MHKARMRRALSICLFLFIWSLLPFSNLTAATPDYERARWDSIHFKPAIDNATNEQCLACHKEVLEPSVLPQSQAGVKANETQAWYQTLDTYTGEQDTFHRRHLASEFAQKVMNLQCNTCHQGNDPREEAFLPDSSGDGSFTLRKMVNPETVCLKCHGQFDYKIMTLTGPWEQVKDMMGNDCVTCHIAFRTNRHKVSYLKADGIEEAGKGNADACYGCHGGRSWYRISYPYPRNPWPGQPPKVPDWAKDRPTQSEARFLIKTAEKAVEVKPVAEKAVEKPAEKAVEKPAAVKTAEKPAEKPASSMTTTKPTEKEAPAK